MDKNPSVRKRVVIAVNEGMRHVDTIAIHVDSSEAYVRRVCEELAANGYTTKIEGRAHNTYTPIKGDQQ